MKKSLYEYAIAKGMASRCTFLKGAAGAGAVAAMSGGLSSVATTAFGADDIVSINQMHLPVNKQVMIHLSSKDVIHGFGIPEMRIKQDAIPGMSIPVHFEANTPSEEFLQKMVGTPREGKGLEIACAQLCGLGHYRMRGYLSIETEDEYNTWLELQAQYLEEEGEEDEWGDEDDW